MTVTTNAKAALYQSMLREKVLEAQLAAIERIARDAMYDYPPDELAEIIADEKTRAANVVLYGHPDGAGARSR